jgi:methyltransferase (TIGR00027 family)
VTKSDIYAGLQTALLLLFNAVFFFAPGVPWFASALATRVSLVVCLAGLALLLVSVFTLRRVIQVAPAPRAGGHLVEAGVYRYLRHPIYTAMVLLVAGLWLRRPTASVAVAGAAVIASLLIKARYEEALLAKQYAEYPRYRARTRGVLLTRGAPAAPVERGASPAAPRTASRTAYRVALHRAAHQLLDHPPVLVDPIAIPILGADTAAALRANPAQFERSRLDPYMRAFMAVRSRVAEDRLAGAREAGVTQYVILGAGLDTFAYRQPAGPGPLRVWEVDQPATQAWKRECLAAAGIPVPDNLTFVAVDFERDSLPDALARAGFDREAGAVFAWLGVSMYLDDAAIEQTLTFLAEATRAGGGVVFDYAVPRDRMTAVQRAIYDRFAARVAAIGEPWVTSFDPDALASRLRALGFATVEDLDAEALNAAYFAGRDDKLHVGSLARIMWAGGAPSSASVPTLSKVHR